MFFIKAIKFHFTGLANLQFGLISDTKGLVFYLEKRNGLSLVISFVFFLAFDCSC